MSKARVPGDDLALDNTRTSVGQEEAEHEERIRRAVAEANAKEQAERETQEAQIRSQKRNSGAGVKEGTVVVPPVRRPEESKYGPELPYPHGTPLNKQLKPCEGIEPPVYISARVMGPNGWLVQRAVPVEQLQGDASA